MRIKQFWPYIENHDKTIAYLEEEEKRLGALYNLIHDPAFLHIKTFFYKMRDEGVSEQVHYGKKPIFTIWMFLKKIWEGGQKREDAESFLSWIESIPQQLHETSEELKRLTQN